MTFLDRNTVWKIDLDGWYGNGEWMAFSSPQYSGGVCSTARLSVRTINIMAFRKSSQPPTVTILHHSYSRYEIYSAMPTVCPAALNLLLATLASNNDTLAHSIWLSEQNMAVEKGFLGLLDCKTERCAHNKAQ